MVGRLTWHEAEEITGAEDGFDRKTTHMSASSIQARDTSNSSAVCKTPAGPLLTVARRGAPDSLCVR